MEQLAEANVWKVVDLDGNVKAYLGTYVDDLIVVKANHLGVLR